MPRPAVPDPADPILASWAGDLIDYIGSKYRHVTLPRTMVVGGVAGPGATPRNVELTTLPANDPTVLGAVVQIAARAADGTSQLMNIVGPGGFSAATAGVASRGGFGPIGIVPVGGTNNRTVAYTSTSTATLCYLYVVGYVIKESAEPVAGDVSPISSSRAPGYPQPGVELTTDWAKALTARAARCWMYVPITLASVPGVAPNLAKTMVSMAGVSGVPDDPRIVALSVICNVRMTDGTSIALEVFDRDGSYAGSVYSVGTGSRFGFAGPFAVLTEGTGQFMFRTSGTVNFQNCTLSVVGYWIAEPEEAA